jgi:hypothetical protein
MTVRLVMIAVSATIITTLVCVAEHFTMLSEYALLWHMTTVMYSLVTHSALAWLVVRTDRLKRKRRQLLDLTIANLPAAVFMINKNKVLIYAGGRALTEAAKIDPKFHPRNVVGKRLEDVVKDVEVIELYEFVLREAKPSQLVHQWKGRQYHSEAVPVNDATIAAVLVTSIDLTTTSTLSERTVRSLRHLRAV